MKPLEVSVIGDGGWGTAAAMLLASNGHRVSLWGHDPDYLREMDAARENRRFLPGFRLPEALGLDPDLGAAVRRAELLVVAVPTPYLRDVLAGGGSLALAPGALAVSLTKGLERQTLERPSRILAAALGGHDVAVLSGPSHAEEVARGLPASVTVAAAETTAAERLQAAFMAPSFRVYTSSDVLGVELGGALKNVMAVAVGIGEGLGLGDNARAALMTRGLAEITRLAVALGARAETFMGLSGMGDLITTCVSPHGRNRAVGLALAEGQPLAQILAGTETVAEGVKTCASVVGLAEREGVEMPICAALHRVLEGEIAAREAVHELMTRAPKAEGVRP
jgi:glycerol-3-phosphate dehydrogenase (NAD(P)+)